MFGTVSPRIAPYFEIVGDHLERRGQAPGDFETGPDACTPAYVLRMAEALLTAVNAHSRGPVTLADILRADTLASGHVDYQRKIALYCAELAEREPVRCSPSRPT